MAQSKASELAAVARLERPSPQLFKLYVIQACFALIAAPLVLIPLYFRYHTLRYRFEEEGIGASWGILFRREIYLSYKRIQDIHVKRNLFERWLGIGTVEVQTASGKAGAELSIEGLVEYEAVRDFLYARMRGHEADEEHAAEPASVEGAAPAGDELARLLREVRDELAATRKALEARS